MRKTIFTIALLSCITALSAQTVTSVSYVPLETKSVTSKPIKEYKQPNNLEPNKRKTVRIYPDITFQQIEGIGGCFNEIGGEALAALKESSQKELLTALFSLDKGIGLSFCRASIGSSDFGIDAYSFSPVADDYEMEHFTMEREKEYMLPYIQKALEVNPDIRLFGSPWSPPAWMKPSGYMDRGVEFPEDNILIDDPRIYRAYAIYMTKYVQQYAEAGVKVERILVQNEQDISTKYPSCLMPVEQMAEFVGKYMRPMFEKNGIETEIWAGTFRTAGELDALRLAASPMLQRPFDGIGIQYTTPHHIQNMTTLAPNVDFMHTEGVCFNGKNDWTQANSRFAEVASYINGGSQNYCYWNMILNETGESGWAWKQNSLITIDRGAKKVIYNPDYAVMSLLSSKIKPQSVRVAAYCPDTTITLAKDNGYTVIMQNDTDQPITYTCIIGDGSTLFEIPANSLCAVEIEE